MSESKQLEDALTLLISVDPDNNLGKLLNLCLVAKADESDGKTARQLASEFLQDPSKINYWAMDLIGSDSNYTAEEWKAVGDLDVKDKDAFVSSLTSELKSLNLD